MQPSLESKPVITRQRNTSPLEELTIRLQGVHPPLKLADHEVVALLHETRLERVEPDGAIRFEIAGRRHEFYDVDSPTCQHRRGQKVLISYSRAFTDVIFVIQPDQKHLDTIPLRAALKWFDHDRAGVEIREQDVLIKRAAKELAELHGGEIQRRHYAGRGNVEKVEGYREARIVNTFPPPAPSDNPQCLPRSERGAIRNPQSEVSASAATDRISDAVPARPSKEAGAPLSPARHDVTGEPSIPILHGFETSRGASDRPVSPPAVPSFGTTRNADCNPADPMADPDLGVGAGAAGLVHQPRPFSDGRMQSAPTDSGRGALRAPIADGRGALRAPIADQIATAGRAAARAAESFTAGRRRARVSYEDALDDLAMPLAKLSTLNPQPLTEDY
jgi:hypothetical protein